METKKDIPPHFWLRLSDQGVVDAVERGFLDEAQSAQLYEMLGEANPPKRVRFTFPRIWTLH
jgi:hypothetical protein